MPAKFLIAKCLKARKGVSLGKSRTLFYDTKIDKWSELTIHNCFLRFKSSANQQTTSSDI